MADMEIVRQFNSELSTLYATKPPISKAKVTSITRLALKAVKYYKHVVQSLEKFVQKCRPEYKIPALYVIDSIIRQSRHQFGAEKDVFGPRFGRNITNSFQSFFKCLPEEQSKLIKVLNLWQKNKVYLPEVIQPLLNMAHTRPMTEQQGSPKLDEDVKAFPADTTQPVVGHMAQHQTAQQPVGVETPQEQAYIALLQQQQEEQMRHIRELEARLQRQQQMNQQLQQGTETGGEEQPGEPKFQLPTDVFAQIQALASMVNQPGGNPPGSYDSEQYSGGGGNYEGLNLPGNYTGSNPPDDYVQQYDQQHQEYPPGKYGEQPMTDQNYQQSFIPGYEERQQDYMAPQQHQGFVDDFDYGDDQDDQQRIEEKKRQLEQEANRLKTASSYEPPDESMNARQRLEEQLRQQQQTVSSIPPQEVPESKPVPETLQPSSESAIPAFQPAFPAAAKSPRSRSRSPRERRHRDGEREYRDSASDRERGRDRQTDGSDRNRPRNRGDRDDRDRTREDRDRARGDRGERDRTRDKARGDRDERERPREERDRPREERERTREEREKSREKSRENRDERERPREERERPREERDRPREERERTRERERGRESDKEIRIKEEQPAEEKKEVKIEKWVPPVKEGHISVCSRTVWLGRMHRNTTKETLQELFQEFGEVQIIDMVPPRGCAYIQMAEREAAYHSLSSKLIIKQNYKLAWAPAKGAKEYKEHFDKELGVTYIPAATLQESEDTISSLAEGGWIDPRTIPEALLKKEEAAAATNAAGQVPGVLGMPLGPPPFAGMPPGAGVPPGMPRLPFGIPGLPLPGMIPPGMNLPGLPGMQFPQGMGNMPFPRLPMNNRLPFLPGVNPFMMPGLLPGMRPGAPMPGMPPFFRGPPPMGGQPPANAPAEAGQPQDGNQGEVAGQSNEGNQEGATEANVPQGENVPAAQGSTESGFQGPPPDQGGPEGQNMPNNGQEAQGPEQFGVPNMGPGGVPPFQGGPPFHGGPGGPPFQPPFGQQGQPPFHGDPRFQGPPQFHDQGGGPPGPWRPAGPDNHWRPEGRPWGPDDRPPNEDWGNEGEHWGPEDEQWRHEDRPWGRGNDRRGRRDRRSQDEWGREEQFDRRKRGRFDDDWGPPHDRHQGPPHDRHQGPPHDRHQGPHHDRHRGRPPFGRDHPPRFGPGRGPPFPMDGPPPFDDRPPWMRDEQRGRWGEEDRPFRGDPVEQQPGFEVEQQPGFEVEQQPGFEVEQQPGFEAEQQPGFEVEKQPGFEVEQQAGGHQGRDPNAPWDDHHGDGRHGDRPRDIPSLMDNQFKPPPEGQGEDPGVPENAASQEEVAKGWAEIKELKARLAKNKNPGDSETTVAHVEGGQAEVGVSNEQSSIADVKPDVNAIAAHVKEELPSMDGVTGWQSNAPDIKPQINATVAPVEGAGGGSNQGGQDNVLESRVRVKIEPPEEGDQTWGSGEHLGVSGGMNVDVPFPVPNFEGEPMTTDAVGDKPDQESSAIAPIASSSQDETMTTDKVLDHPKVDRCVVLLDAASSQERVDVSEPGIQVTHPGMEQNVTADKVDVGKKLEPAVGSDVPKQMGDNMGSGEVSMGSGKVKMGSREVKMESSEEFRKQSEEVNMGSEEVMMGSSYGNMGSDEVNKGPRVVSMGSEIRSDHVDVGSMETTKPGNVESVVVETPSQSEAPTKSVETNAEFAGNMEEKSTPVESKAIEKSIEGSSMGDEVSDLDKKLQARVQPNSVVQQEADTTSEANPEMDQILSDPVDTNISEATGDV